MKSDERKELVEILINQKTSKKSVHKFREWIVGHAKYVKEIDEEIVKFAKIPNAPKTNVLGCLYGIHEILAKVPKLRCYFAVGLSRSVKCLLSSLRAHGTHDEFVEKLVRVDEKRDIRAFSSPDRGGKDSGSG